MSLAECIKYTLDCVLPIPALLGLRGHRVFVTEIKYTGERPGIGTRTRIDTELFIGDGYPIVDHVSSKDVFLSGGLLTDKDFKLTLVPTYNTGINSGGTSRDIFQPQPDGYNTQIYFHIYGEEFPPNGQYFKQKYNFINGNLIEIFLSATAENPGLS